MNTVPRRKAFEAEYFPYTGWRVIGPDPKLAEQVYRNRNTALSAAGRANSAWDRDRKRVKRPCMCCRAEFMSEGIHNRMCNDCRNRATEVEGPYRVASRGGRPK